MWKVNENNVWQEPVEQKNHSKYIGILSHHVPYDIANNYLINLKHLNIITWRNNNKLTSQSLRSELVRYINILKYSQMYLTITHTPKICMSNGKNKTKKGEKYQKNRYGWLMRCTKGCEIYTQEG